MRRGRNGGGQPFAWLPLGAGPDGLLRRRRGRGGDPGRALLADQRPDAPGDPPSRGPGLREDLFAGVDYLNSASGDWSGTLSNFTAAQLIAAGFSTTTADAWLVNRNFFATTSADYLATQRNFFSTTSADAWKTARSFFATTSNDYWLTQKGLPRLKLESAAVRAGDAKGSNGSGGGEKAFVVEGVVSAEGGPLPTQLDVTLETAKGDTTTTLKPEGTNWKFKVESNDKPIRVSIPVTAP